MRHGNYQNGRPSRAGSVVMGMVSMPRLSNMMCERSNATFESFFTLEGDIKTVQIRPACKSWVWRPACPVRWRQAVKDESTPPEKVMMAGDPAAGPLPARTRPGSRPAGSDLATRHARWPGILPGYVTGRAKPFHALADPAGVCMAVNSAARTNGSQLSVIASRRSAGSRYQARVRVPLGILQHKTGRQQAFLLGSPIGPDL